MNLQERLECILNERRGYVASQLHPDSVSEGLHSGLAEYAENARQADLKGDQHDRDNWLVRLAGLALFLLHQEDEVKPVDVGTLPLYAKPGQPVCGAQARGGPCALVRGHNRGYADVLENHLARRTSPPVPSQAGIAHAFTGLNEAAPRGYEIVGGDDITWPVVYKKGDGTYRLKPRPDTV